jgi:hypothetical protein
LQLALIKTPLAIYPPFGFLGTTSNASQEQFMGIKGINAFNAVFAAAREEGTNQGNKVSFSELKKSIDALKSDDGMLSRKDLQHFAQTISNEPYLTAPAKKEAFALLKNLGSTKLDAAGIDAIKAEFSLRNSSPFSSLQLPGRAIKNTLDLPDAVAKAVANMHDQEADDDFEEVDVTSATLAGQAVYLVKHSWLGGNGDAQKIQVFSRDGKRLATGAIGDAMAGFSWN